MADETRRGRRTVVEQIVSASRRTDIPRYFGRWFAGRRREGFAEFRTAYGVRGRVSLRTTDVLAYLFWTRDARAFRPVLRELRSDAVPYAFQYTITGYGRPLEAHVPAAARVLDDFLAVAADLPGPACIQWRYDPVVLGRDWPPARHVQNFRAIARALAGATAVVNTSLTEPYARTLRRMQDASIEYRRVDPSRHRAAAGRGPAIGQAGVDAARLLDELSAIAAEHGMQLRACCDPEPGLPASQCCGPELFAPYGKAVLQAVGSLAAAPSRPHCRCVRTVDIGMDDTCVAGCRYCYAVRSQQTALDNVRRHDPDAPSLR